MLEIYGDKRSRAFRTHWLARELGIPHEVIDISPAGAHAYEGLEAINPNRKVPAIDDDGFKLFESLAINLYLAKKHGKLYPTTLEDEALLWQWCFWAATEIETDALIILEGRGDKAAAAENVIRPLTVLDEHFATRDYLIGTEFSVGDLNLAAIISWLRFGGFDFSRWPNVAEWLERCTSRPKIRS